MACDDASGSITVVIAAAALAATGFAATRTKYMDAQGVAGRLRRQRHVSALASATPGGRVFADGRYADWLLWNAPELRGRVAYDVRFELLSPEQTRLLFNYDNRVGDTWRAATTGYPLIVLDPVAEGQLETGLLAHNGYIQSRGNARPGRFT